ncbi:imidazoleglycerol-phosphate synthase [Ascoidea rubescens DSM 1968]|uniref:Imidazole glycerol phosphate synthase hisHF n=1 Tax=Ascoidea rubescens DSM 1968 TaxID=1344418 RepID=A0A1D2VIA5_9ASCO|nr:imidazole glycerol phosphate synthase HisHF [Ascoidea rubescens DSM 1968]ODV61382.1 imidazole glycerol phosphate synthase HisHF [Ascoidea rubescens DSM 1968]
MVVLLSKTVHIIDVKSGNLKSLQNAIEHLGYKAIFIEDGNNPELLKAEKLILPGVGNYDYFVEKLFQKNFEKPLKDYINSKKPIFGICVGLQALFNTSEESFNSKKGLGLIDINVSKFKDATKSVPQIGWNKLRLLFSLNASLPSSYDSAEVELYGLNPNYHYYFVHSYAAIINDQIKQNLLNEGWNLGITTYGDQQFISAINKDNLFATQFHPEKSGKAGLKMIKHFLSGKKYTSIPRSNFNSNNKNLKNFNGLTCRIIACLDVRSNDQGDLVVTKGDQYDVREKDDNGNNVRNLGKPVALAEKYYKQGADEITFLNITSFRNSPLRDQPMLNVLREASKTCFVPLTIGGGIRDYKEPNGTIISSLKVAELYFLNGADKVSIGSDAVTVAENYFKNGSQGSGNSPIELISKQFGVQAVVISVDPKKRYVNSPDATLNKVIKTKFPGPNGENYCWYQCTTKGGREYSNIGAYELTTACEALGAGEILLNCIDKDGSNSGFDLELVDHIKKSVSIPVISSSGAGNPQHFREVFEETSVDAALGAGIFHREEYTVGQVKEYLLEHGFEVRFDNGIEI